MTLRVAAALAAWVVSAGAGAALARPFRCVVPRIHLCEGCGGTLDITVKADGRCDIALNLTAASGGEERAGSSLAVRVGGSRASLIGVRPSRRVVGGSPDGRRCFVFEGQSFCE